MSKTRTLALQPNVESRDHATSVLQAPGQAVIVYRGKPRWFVLQCPCGCGDNISVNLDPRTGPAWRLYDSKCGLTVYPSVWRESGCQSHFIVWNNRILWLDSYDEDFYDHTLETAVEGAFMSQPKHFAAIADELGAIPWDVLTIARSLARHGILVEGQGQKQGWFERPRPNQLPGS